MAGMRLGLEVPLDGLTWSDLRVINMRDSRLRFMWDMAGWVGILPVGACVCPGLDVLMATWDRLLHNRDQGSIAVSVGRNQTKKQTETTRSEF